MGFAETAIFYTTIGIAVAVATALRSTGPRAWLLLLPAGLFWPIFAPILWGATTTPPDTRRSASNARREAGGIDDRVKDAEAQVLDALGQLDGIAQEVLAPQATRVTTLVESLSKMSNRVMEMQALLTTDEFDASRAQSKLTELIERAESDDDPRVQSVRARLRNIDRLAKMCRRAEGDLERAILQLEEMASQLVLLKFAARPDDEVVERIKEIADGVEEVTSGLLATT